MGKTRIIIVILACLLFISAPFIYGAEMKAIQRSSLETLLFVPNRALLIGDGASGLRGSIRFWSLSDGQLKHTIEFEKNIWVKSMAVSHDGDLIAVALFGNDEMGCYSIKESKWLWRVKWPGKKRYRYNLRFTPDDKGIVIKGLETIITYDARNGNILRQLKDSSAFSGGFPAYKTAFSTLSESGRYAAIWQGNLEHDETLDWNPNVWVAVWDLDNKQIIGKQGEIQIKYKNCAAVFTPDEKHVLLGSMDGAIRDWSISEQKPIRQWQVYDVGNTKSFDKRNTSPSPVGSLIFSANGRFLATLGFEPIKRETIRIYDYMTNKLVKEFTHIISINAMCGGYPMAFSPDSKHFVLENKGNICLYSTADWRQKWCVPSKMTK
jgi:WD40 repeat protein